MRIHASTTIEAPNRTNLLKAWKLYGGPGSLVGAVRREARGTVAAKRAK